MMASRKNSPPQSRWPDLLPDLLCDVLRRLPSLADRIRLRAVCSQWRTGAKILPPRPPQLPWLASPDGTAFDVANKKKHRLSIPLEDGPCYSAGDNMFFVHHNDGRCSLVNGFSGAATALPELDALLASHAVSPQAPHDDMFGHPQPMGLKIAKVAMSSTAGNNTAVAVLVSNRTKSRVLVSTCRPAGETNSCVATPEISTVVDVAFFQGKVFALVRPYEELVAIDLGDLDAPTAQPGGVKPCTSWIKPRDRPYMLIPPMEIERCLVESNGKLLMVRTRVRPIGRNGFNCRLDVLEADLARGPRLGRWKEAESLDGRALFVGTPSSKSVAAAGNGDGARGDCIYFLVNYCADPLRHPGVYSLVDKTIVSLMPASVTRTVNLSGGSRRFPAWFFPVET